MSSHFFRAIVGAVAFSLLATSSFVGAQPTDAPANTAAPDAPSCVAPTFVVDPSGKTETQISGRLKRFVIPTYPLEALASGLGNAVSVTATVDAIGSVKAISRVTTQPESAAFEAAVRAVATNWHFAESLDCRCAPKDEAEVSVVVLFEVNEGQPKISVMHRQFKRDGAVLDSRFPGAKFQVLNYDEVRREIKYPLLARRAGVQANLYTRLEYDTSTGRVTKAAINKIITAKKFEWVFAQELEGTLEKFRIAPISEKPATIGVCLPLVFRLTN